MEASFVVAIIERDIAEKPVVTVLLHEVPVLEAVHKKSIVPADIAPLVGSREVDLHEEYERLVNQYGEDENGIPHVERVYGRPDEFVEKVESLYAAQHGEPKQRLKRKTNQKADDESQAEDESNAG